MIFVYRRCGVRLSELVSLVAISVTFFLLMYIRDLQMKLSQMEERFQAEDFARTRVDQVSEESAMSTVNTILQQLKESTEMNELDVRTLNNTRLADKELIFFNRVPKVGSQSFMKLLRILGRENGFLFHKDPIHDVEIIRLVTAEQKELAAIMNNYSTPSVYVQHVCFINFTQFSLPSPIYVNIVRDPVERVISWFYYLRAPWYYILSKKKSPEKPLPDPWWMMKDFETCVLNGDKECQYIEGETKDGNMDFRRQTLFFCGHSSACMPFNSHEALQKSKRVVEQNYAVVGVLEDLNSTLTVFEQYIPLFFKEARKVY